MQVLLFLLSLFFLSDPFFCPDHQTFTRILVILPISTVSPSYSNATEIVFLVSPFDTHPPSQPCTGSGWEGVSFPHSSPYRAVFWICDYNSVDNTPMF